MKKIILTIFSVIIVVLVFFSPFFINKSFAYKRFASLKNYFGGDLRKENLSLKIQNENLKAQLSQIKGLSGLIFEGSGLSAGQFIEARIFSTYPFNVKDMVVIDKGTADGVFEGMPVVLGDDVLFGRVTEVLENSANVRTVFDSNWEFPVKISDEKVNGLFKGGNRPKISLIEKPIKQGDAVFTASKDFLRPLKIGDINEVETDGGGIFEDATIKTVYNINEIEYVRILK